GEGRGASAGAARGALWGGGPPPSGGGPPAARAARGGAAGSLAGQFDPRRGGFGGAPKFPPAMRLEFLLRYWLRTGEPRAREMVDVTLSRMAAGGMYDQIGGGFHRYSVDAEW